MKLDGCAILCLAASATVFAACSATPALDDSPVFVEATGARPQTSSKKPGPRLYEFRAESPGLHCATGGQALLTGTDDNGNDVLDPWEISSTQYICNGTDGRTPVMSTRAVPIGAACPTGGQAISWGYDNNRNTVLDASEVKQTAYVCNGQNGQNGANGQTSVVVVLPQSPNQYCATGGQGVYTGLDLNGDGLLQPTEVKATSFVCNGANGQNGASGVNALVRTESEPAGANCTNGGVRVLSGLDTNGDGALSAAEATNTSYVCHGAAGAQGPVGPQGPAAIATRVSVTAEPAGANCAAAGQRIDVGPDANANGTLDPGEIAQTRYICNGVGGAAPGVQVVTRLEGLFPASLSPPGCSLGSMTVVAGPDASGDGVLQAEEETTRITLCRRARVASTNVCGTNYTLEVGLDGNFNGALDSAEISSTVCGTRLVALAAGGAHTCAVLTGGRAHCWGRNDSGQLGSGAVGGASPSPGPPLSLSGVVSISAGTGHSCAVLTDGTARCWGWNGSGQVGDGTTLNRASPTSVSGLLGVAAISAGDQHTCARSIDGSARCWGINSSGQLGDGTTQTRLAPTLVSGLSGAASISAGFFHTCAQMSDGTARCWGENFYGQLGDGTTTNRLVPTQVPGATGVTGSVSVGYRHTCAQFADGSARCWGWNESGQLGDGTTTNRLVPTLVSGVSGVASISTNYVHTCASSTDGTAQCWGYGGSGRLGDGTAQSRILPTSVSGAAQFASIAAGTNHTCALATDGPARCWGSNAFGQLGDGTTQERDVPVGVIFDIP